MVSLFQVKAIDTVELFIRSVCNMGSYLNPGNASFRNSLRSKIYVDKSELIARTNELICTEQRYVCVSRPRRFGKSMAAKFLVLQYFIIIGVIGFQVNIARRNYDEKYI